MTAADAIPRRIAGLDITSAEDGYIIFEPERDRVHYLNDSAVLILELSTGNNSVPQIASLIQQAYALPEPPLATVRDTVAKLHTQGLLTLE